MTREFIDNSVRYLINNDDYYYFAELAFLDLYARNPHDEKICFIKEIQDKSGFNYTPNRFAKARLIQ